jgi:hypothetical protein
MKSRLLVLSAMALFAVSLFGCGKKEEAAPVAPDDSKYVSPPVSAAPGPGGASGAATKPGAPTTQ